MTEVIEENQPEGVQEGHCWLVKQLIFGLFSGFDGCIHSASTVIGKVSRLQPSPPTVKNMYSSLSFPLGVYLQRPYIAVHSKLL